MIELVSLIFDQVPVSFGVRLHCFRLVCAWWYFQEMLTHLCPILLGHPFSNAKSYLWLHIIQAFFWELWKERNEDWYYGRKEIKQVFMDKGQPFATFFDLVIYYTIS